MQTTKETVTSYEVQFSIDGERWHFQSIHDTLKMAREVSKFHRSDESCSFRIVKVTVTTESEVVK